MGAKSGETSSARVRSQKQADRRVTSVDVAAESGVSQATVARVYSSPHKVAPATRDKVRAAAERLGYVPNAIARSLKSQRTNIVGAVVPAYGEYWQNVLAEFSRQLAHRYADASADRPASVVVPGTIRYGKTTRKSDG